VFEGLCQVRWAGRRAVVALPAHMGVSNAGQIGEELLSVINSGATALIADMTATIWCDHAGAGAVVRAFQRAIITGTELRLVVTAPHVSRVLSLSGVDRLVPIHPSREAAMAVSAPAAVRAGVAGPARAGTGRQALPHRAGRVSRPVQAAGPAGGNGEASAPALVWKLADAPQDGVALADADGTIAPASTPLEHMFGYQHGEQRGHPADSLIPAGLQAAHPCYRASYAQAPAARAAPAGQQPPREAAR
jgi:anti-sigma B factor antagonist